MNIKAKKENADGIVRVETSGEVKEIILKEDFLHPKEVGVQICFRGKSSSGIVEVSPKELEKIYRDAKPQMEMLKSSKIMKFEK